MKRFDSWALEAGQRRRREYEEAVRAKDWRSANAHWFEFFRVFDSDENRVMGEDYGFCWKAKALGFEVWADPKVLPGHFGPHAFSVRDWRAQLERETASGPA